MSDEQNSADFLRAAMSSFFHRAQKKDCEPVVKVYFERLPEVFSDRDRIFGHQYESCDVSKQFSERIFGLYHRFITKCE